MNIVSYDVNVVFSFDTNINICCCTIFYEYEPQRYLDIFNLEYKIIFQHNYKYKFMKFIVSWSLKYMDEINTV